MKFQKKYTELLKRVLKYSFGISVLLISIFIILLFLLQRIQTCTYINDRITYCEVYGVNTEIILGISAVSMILSIVVLILIYLVYVIAEGLEKPKFIDAKRKHT